MNDENRVVASSVVLEGEYGYSGVSSVSLYVGIYGVRQYLRCSEEDIAEQFDSA